MNGIIRNGNLETQYTESDFVNADNYDSHDSKQRAFVILDAGYVKAIVFSEYPAYTEQDAMDEAADSGKLDGLQCNETELKDYQVGFDSEGNPEYEGIVNLGNAGEPFASESMDVWVVSASIFAEELFLMTPERVAVRLEEFQDEAEREYKKVPTESPDWSKAYSKTTNLEDTITLLRLTQAR